MKQMSIVFKIDDKQEEPAYLEIKEILKTKYKVKETEIRPFSKTVRIW